MGNRGEDASRANGAWGRQPPRQSSSGTGAAGTGAAGAGAWDDRSRGYWQDDDYPTGGGAGYGYGTDDGYPGQERGYGQNDGQYGPYEGQYGQYDAEPEPGWGANPGYRQSGGYPEVPQGSGGYPEQDAGNDWYGGQPAAANGASFADTGTYRLNGRIIDEYGTGPRGALGGDGYGTGARGALYDADRDHGYRAAPSRQGHSQLGSAGSGGYPTAGGYDDYRDDGGYQASGQYNEPGYGDYGQPAAYEAAPGGGRYDEYGDYGAASDPHGDADSRSAERPRRGGRGPARDGARGGRSGVRTLLLAALAVVVVGVAGVAAYVFVLKPKSPAANTNAFGPLPTGSAQASQQACVKNFCHIALRSDDPTALTTAELFPPAFKNEKDKISYQLVTTKVDKTCSTAVIGADLTKALKSGNCTQVLRATYLSGDGKIMGTIGVVNLATTHEAHYAGKVVGKTDFIAPLTAAKGAAKKLGKGTGVVEAQFKGHYLILTWSEFADGTTPSTTAQDKQLEQFGTDLVSGTANISLTQRMVTGAPSTPGATAS